MMANLNRSFEASTFEVVQQVQRRSLVWIEVFQLPQNTVTAVDRMRSFCQAEVFGIWLVHGRYDMKMYHVLLLLPQSACCAYAAHDSPSTRCFGAETVCVNQATLLLEPGSSSTETVYSRYLLYLAGICQVHNCKRYRAGTYQVPSNRLISGISPMNTPMRTAQFRMKSSASRSRTVSSLALPPSSNGSKT